MKWCANGGGERVMMEPISWYTQAQCQLISETRICYKWRIPLSTAVKQFGLLAAILFSSLPLHL